MWYSGIMNMMKKKDNLISFEKNKRIVQQKKKEKVSLGRRYAAVGTAVLAAVCVIYCVCIRLFMGYGTNFFLIWGVLGVCLGILAFLLWNRALCERIPRILRRMFWFCAALGLVLFVVTEGFIFSQFQAKARDGADCMIVLGAWWKNDRPSYILKQRLDTAIAYLQQNPDTYVIASGGKGSNEVIPEAEGMAMYLEKAGIESERIICEDRSENTDENLRFSADYCRKEEDRVVLVTNNFHMFRALKIAQKQGYGQVEGLAAPSYPTMVPNNLLREFLGVVKDLLVGNM